MFRLFCATFAALSLALQNHVTDQRAQLASKNSQSHLEGWSDMLEAFKNDKVFSHDVCSTDGYDAYFKRLPAVNMANMQIPPNTKILFYGTSFLHEVSQNVVAANEDILIKGPLGGMEGDVLDMDETTKWMTGWLTSWNFTVNSMIVEVQNYQKLQFPENAANLEKFLQDHEFDVAFFMNPHPTCHFDPGRSPAGSYCECFRECHRSPDCEWIHDCNPKFAVDGSLRGPREDVEPLWNVIKEGMKGKVYEVEAWTTEERTSFHADEEHTIKTYPILSADPCNQHDDCTGKEGPELYGHQCQPGRVTSVAELIMTKVNSAR